MSFSVYGSNKRDYTQIVESLADNSLDGNFKSLKVNDASVLTSADVSGKLDKSGGTMTGLLTLASDGLSTGGTTYSASTLKSKLDSAGTTVDVSGKLDTSAIGDKSLDGNFKTLKVMDTSVVTDVSGKLDKSGGTMTGVLTLATAGLSTGGTTFTAAQVKSSLNLTVSGGTINGALQVTGGTTLSSGCNIQGSHVINMGSDQTKEFSAGKIGYQTYTTGALDIVGAGTSTGSRNIKLWDNVIIPGTLNMTGLLTIGSSGISTGGTTYTAAQVKTALDEASAALPKSGGTMTGNLNGITPTQLGYLTNISSDVQSQLNGKQASGSYALSSDLSAKLNSSAIGDKSLDGNFKTLKVNDTSVVTDVSGKLDKSGGTMTGSLSLGSNSLTCGALSCTSETDTGILNCSGLVTASGGIVCNNSGMNVTGSNVIQLGSDVVGKDGAAGKIGYQSFTSNALDMVGAGTAPGSRNIKLWDNVIIPGTLNVGGGFNVTGATYSYTKNSQNSVPSDIYFGFSEIGSPPAGFYAFSVKHDATPGSYNVGGFFVSTGSGFAQVRSMGGVGMTISEDSNTANIYLYNIVTIWSYTLRANRLV